MCIAQQQVTSIQIYKENLHSKDGPQLHNQNVQSNDLQDKCACVWEVCIFACLQKFKKYKSKYVFKRCFLGAFNSLNALYEKMYKTPETLLQGMHFLYGTTTRSLRMSVSKYISYI